MQIRPYGVVCTTRAFLLRRVTPGSGGLRMAERACLQGGSLDALSEKLKRGGLPAVFHVRRLRNTKPAPPAPLQQHRMRASRHGGSNRNSTQDGGNARRKPRAAAKTHRYRINRGPGSLLRYRPESSAQSKTRAVRVRARKVDPKPNKRKRKGAGGSVTTRCAAALVNAGRIRYFINPVCFLFVFVFLFSRMSY